MVCLETPREKTTRDRKINLTKTISLIPGLARFMKERGLQVSPEFVTLSNEHFTQASLNLEVKRYILEHFEKIGEIIGIEGTRQEELKRLFEEYGECMNLEGPRPYSEFSGRRNTMRRFAGNPQIMGLVPLTEFAREDLEYLEIRPRGRLIIPSGQEFPYFK
jgi:hypothetical protein